MAVAASLQSRRGGTTGLKRPKLSLVKSIGVLLISSLIFVTWSLWKSTSLSVSSTSPPRSSPSAASKLPSGLSSARPITDSASAEPITIAYVISLIKCGDKQSSAVGLTDAALVLRHSVHQTSVRAGKSKYDYKMYAIVHTQAVKCSQPLKDAGFEIVVKDSPVAIQEIQGEYLRTHIHKEWCCGADEFIKLYAYKFSEPIAVHVDIDFVFYKPMDDLFDAMLSNDPKARPRIPLERPTDPWPDRVDAFLTRDWGQVMPGRKPGYQAGFLVVRPDPTVFEELLAIIRKGDFVDGFQRANGWGGLGYGAFVGAMAMQGLLAYYYDNIRPYAAVELNQCRFNHMGMDVLYRSQPSFRRKHPKVGKCRNNREYCEDCQTTALEDIYNIHYTQCRKPWNCIAVGSTSPDATKMSIPEDSVRLDHCMELLTVWHAYRRDLEAKLLELTGDTTIEQGQGGAYKKYVFQGHCQGEGQEHYLALSGRPESWKHLPELYS